MRVYQFRHAGIVGIPEKGPNFLPIRGPVCKHNPPTHSYSSAWPLGIGDLTCGALSHIIPGPIFGFKF